MFENGGLLNKRSSLPNPHPKEEKKNSSKPTHPPSILIYKRKGKMAFRPCKNPVSGSLGLRYKHITYAKASDHPGRVCTVYELAC